MTNDTVDELVKADLRHASRQKTFAGGKIIINKNSTYNCVVKSRSEQGFGLKMGSTNGIPDEFTLVDELKDKRYLCRVVWRRRTALGVEIIK